jgi:hypothetical protein
MQLNRTPLLIAVGGLVAVLAAVTAALALNSHGGSGSRATKQRVAIVTQGLQNDPGSPVFELIPLRAGALERDSGTEKSSFARRVMMRKGQSVDVIDGVETLRGERGSLKLRFRIEWVEAGNEYRVGTGTWKLLRGTGQYAEITGGGRRGDVWLDRGRGPWSGRAEGFLTSRP